MEYRCVIELDKGNAITKLKHSVSTTIEGYDDAETIAQVIFATLQKIDYCALPNVLMHLLSIAHENCINTQNRPGEFQEVLNAARKYLGIKE